MDPYFTALSVVSATILGWGILRKMKGMAPHPPGPPGWPIIGNLLHFPRAYEHEQYDKWAQEYASDIIYLNVLNQPIVVLNSQKAADDLLARRSDIYSSRPPIPMFQLIGGYDQTMPLLPYGETWRRSRQLFGDVINKRTNSRFYPLIEKATHRLLHYLLEQPQDFQRHIVFFGGSTMLNVTYGLDIQASDDPLLTRFADTFDAIVHAALPGAYLVNVIPLLKYIPTWFPGSGFKSYAAYLAEETKSITHGTFNISLSKIEEGNSNPSFVYDATKDLAPEELQRKIGEIINCASTMYAAAVDTTSSAITSFILAMTRFPSVCKKAQQEIDRVCGTDLLPSVYETDRLPYVMAIILEVLRWQVPLALGVPHFIEVTDTYNGYTIPAGSIVMANIWSMLHDQTKYPNPEIFDPERFLKDGNLCTDIGDPRDVVFGFGRRLCPGRELALSSIWAAVTGILTTMDIEASEETVLPESARCFKSAIVRHPIHFKCNIHPRSKKTEGLVRILQHAKD